MLFTCAHAYTRTTHAHACALYLDIQAKPKTFLRAHTRVLQGIYIRGRTYAHARAQISKNIYCIHYYTTILGQSALDNIENQQQLIRAHSAMG